MPVHGVRIVWDSELNRTSMPKIGGRPFVHNMMCNKPLSMTDFHVPHAMTRDFRIEGVRADGSTQVLFSTNNYQRLNKIGLSGTLVGHSADSCATRGGEYSSFLEVF